MAGRSFRFWAFKSPQDILESSLGDLERSVLEVAWASQEFTVREACAQLTPPVAYATVMTTMDRLFKKGLLTRRQVGRAYIYRAAAPRDVIEHSVAAELVQSLLEKQGEPLPVLSSLVEAVSARDDALLDELERLIREKRGGRDKRSR
jgi:predicted transcriptional regulator